MLHNRVTSAARERAQRAQRAKRRKDTANSHEQLQGAPFRSVRRHVPASLIIITRFPFTYQTGLGWIWGHILDKNSMIFNVFRHSFSGYDFSCDYVSFGASLCAPRCPKMTFLLQKNSYFHGFACFSKVVGIISNFMDFYRFLVSVLAYLCLLLGSSFVH